MDRPDAERFLQRIAAEEALRALRTKLTPNDAELGAYMRARSGFTRTTFSPREIALAREAFTNEAVAAAVKLRIPERTAAPLPGPANDRDQQGYRALLAAASGGGHGFSPEPPFAVLPSEDGDIALFNQGDEVLATGPGPATQLVLGDDIYELGDTDALGRARVTGLTAQDACDFERRHAQDLPSSLVVWRW